MTLYKVVVNHEEQYSIWPADDPLPLGWEEVGKTGSKEECLAFVKEVWTDMRPLSLRQDPERKRGRAQPHAIEEATVEGEQSAAALDVSRV